MDLGPGGPAPHHCVMPVRVLALPNLTSPAVKSLGLDAAQGPLQLLLGED